MILVTLGTQLQPFTRLLDAINAIDTHNEEIIVQAGCTKYEGKKMQIFDFVSYEKMDELVNRARVIITHGGTGSIVDPLKKGKVIIGCARLKKYGEHVDDHQTELISIFTEEGHILEYKDGDNLEEILEKAKSFKPKKYISNTPNFIKLLKDEIDKRGEE